MAKRPFHQPKNLHLFGGSNAGLRWGAPLVAFLVLSTMALWTQATAWAAPRVSAQYQTVPKPTKEPTNTPVPTATPRRDPTATPRRDDNNNPSPTNTPVPTVAPVETGPTGVVSVVVLNVREGPGTVFSVIGTVTQSTVVEVMERNADGSWWRICCIVGTEEPGWVSAQFITPNFDAARALELIPLATEIPAPPTAPVLQLDVRMQPAFVWAGQEFTLDFAITNLSADSVQNVSFGTELAPTLAFVSTTTSGDGAAANSAAVSGATLVEATWAELAAGATANVTIALRVTDTMANGDVIDNLAVVGADGVDDITAGISIGMPPTMLPDFK
ncbi:MAG: SH3 domain-containing protein [Caldilineaceae bacterium]